MTRTERTYYAIFGIYSLCAWFLAPIYPLFLRSRGLDALEVNLVLGTYFVVMFATDVPTGAAADRFGRKRVFLLACLLRALAFALYAMADDFVDCLVGELVDGLGSTLANGSLDAWAVDGMHGEGDRRPTERFFARSQALSRVAMIVGGFACTELAVVDYALPWWIAAGGFVATALVAACWMDEPRAKRSELDPPVSLLATMIDGVRLLRRAPVVFVVCVLTAGAFFAAVPAHMLWQVHLLELSGGDLRAIGWIWMAMNVCVVFGSAVLPKLLGRWPRASVLFGAGLTRAFALGIAAISPRFAPAAAGWLLQEATFGLSEPVLQSWMNEHTTAQLRATALSVRTSFGTIGGALGLVAIGFVARDHGVPAAWGVSALIFLAIAPGYLLLGREAAAPTTLPADAAGNPLHPAAGGTKIGPA